MDWSLIIPLLIAFWQVKQHDKSIKEERKREIQLSLSSAYHKTESYYCLIEQDYSKRDRSRELDIAEAWNKVGILIADFDKVLSQKLVLKSKLWQDGDLWNEERIKQGGIELRKLNREVHLEC